LGILIEGLKKLKSLRENRVEKLIGAEITMCEIGDLAKLYDSIEAIEKRINLMSQEEEMFTFENDKLRKMKGEFSHYWNNLSHDKQNKLIQKLIDLNQLPGLLGESLAIFGGRFINII
jgi:regulator of replication initiation timing